MREVPYGGLHVDLVSQAADELEEAGELGLNVQQVMWRFAFSTEIQAKAVINELRYRKGVRERIAKAQRKKQPEKVWREPLTYDEAGGDSPMTTSPAPYGRGRVFHDPVAQETYLPSDFVENFRPCPPRSAWNSFEFRTRQPTYAYRKARRLHHHRQEILQRLRVWLQRRIRADNEHQRYLFHLRFATEEMEYELLQMSR